jgi:hypothetical protein
MLQLPIELVDLHDALVKVPSQQHVFLIVREFKENVKLGSEGKYIAIMQGKLLYQNHRGDGKVTCWYCGRPLDNSLSRVRGCGPICLGKYGPIPGREKVEIQITNMYLGYVAEQRKLGKKHLGIRKWLDVLPDNEFSQYWKKFVESVDPKTRRQN